MNNELDIFGKFIIENFRDRAISSINTLLNGENKAPSLSSLQTNLSLFSNEEKEILKTTFIKSIDSGLHDYLLALQEATDNNKGIEQLVNGKNIAKLSDGLQGELFTEDGWLYKYSSYGEPSE